MNTVIKNIILEYCQGNEHLEFDYADLDDMVDRIAHYKQLTLTDVVKQSELLACDNCKYNCLVWDDNHPCATCAGMDNYEKT